MKILVETTGEFMLIDREQRLSIEAHRPAVSERTQFINVQLGYRALHVLGDLKDEATDEEFQKYVAESDGDTELAVASFLAAFSPETSTKKTTRRGRRTKTGDTETDGAE